MRVSVTSSEANTDGVPKEIELPDTVPTIAVP